MAEHDGSSATPAHVMTTVAVVVPVVGVLLAKFVAVAMRTKRLGTQPARVILPPALGHMCILLLHVGAAPCS